MVHGHGRLLSGKLIIDVGTGSGRHAYQAAQFGAQVVAVDIGDSIDVARQNLPSSVLTVQADAEALPFADDTFDMVISIGVLHHLPNTRRALHALTKYVRPGGHLHIYLYWKPPYRLHRLLLRLVTALRTVTVRMPHKFLHLFCYPFAAALYALIVCPYRFMRNRRGLKRIATFFPLKTYADYPFSVCLNDQFDRLSAPIEQRFTADEVQELLESAGLVDIKILPNHGWIGSGRKPVSSSCS